MKVLYLESKIKNLKSNLSNKEIAKLPKQLFLAYSIQYQSLAKLIKKQLESSNIIITGFQQVLGCSKINTKHPILLMAQEGFMQ